MPKDIDEMGCNGEVTQRRRSTIDDPGHVDKVSDNYYCVFLYLKIADQFVAVIFGNLGKQIAKCVAI